MDVQLVGSIDHLNYFTEDIPKALRAASSAVQINFKIGLYDSESELRTLDQDRVKVSIIGLRRKENQGFGANHNELFFSLPRTASAFVVLNPDCIPGPSSIDRLVETFENNLARERGKVAIVEGRQWPHEHPKKYDPNTGQTPWASAAFALFSSEFFHEVNGFDANFFLYLEDVDISWMAWRQGWQVLYEPSAAGWHWTGFPHYAEDEHQPESLFVFQNFPKLLYKHFGSEGAEMAKKFMSGTYPRHLVEEAVSQAKESTTPLDPTTNHKQVKVKGFNLYHLVREH